ncbi:hypothetical protein LINPERPRIM_LOCUS21075, partial [Linum perenne]
CAAPIVAEARALLTAIELAAELGGETCVKTDCLSLVDALRNNPSNWPWQCTAWIHRMSNILKGNPLIRVSFIPRALNGMADSIG